MKRREFIVQSGAALSALGMVIAPPVFAKQSASDRPRTKDDLGDWSAVRAQFNLTPDLIHMCGFYLASHPTPVREAIERHRRGLDADPIGYHHDHNLDLTLRVMKATGEYLGVDPDDIALTDSTTMGLGLMYGSLALKPHQVILTTTHDHPSTYRSLELRAERTGAAVRKVALYDRSRETTVDEVVSRLTRAITPATRYVALTWVHSSTGVKLPIRAVADALAELNRRRGEKDRIILCVDGVHGLGIEEATLPDLGCDCFTAGTHKWIFGPRGTGFLWARPECRSLLQPIIPPFVPASIKKRVKADPGLNIWGLEHSPGGFHSFEHRWAVTEAFEMHQSIGKPRVQARIHALNTRLKDGLADMKHVTLHTPRAPELSAGIVCFEVAGLSPEAVVENLASKRIVASVSPYDVAYARLAPSLLNDEAEVDVCLGALHAMAD